MNEIQPLALRDRLERGDDLTIVDIRESDEFESWHIHGSRNLPVYNALRMQDTAALTERAPELPTDRPIVTVCRMGIMSQRAAQILGQLGLEAFSLEGGIRGWNAVWTEARVQASSGVRCIQLRRNGKGCLSYLVGNDKLAVVDPSLDVEVYRELAHREGGEITHVLETHVHADHLSRARQLSRATGAQLVMLRNDRVQFDYRAVADGDTIEVGDLPLEVLATPGHTGESACYRVDESVLLTGDTMFVNAVGRPDLERGDAGATAGAQRLFQSLHERLLALPSSLRIYPAHHGESIGFDGEPIGASIGEVVQRFDLLQAGESDFVSRVVESLTAKPGNHETIIAVNEGRLEWDAFDPVDLEAGPNRCAAG